MPLALRRTITGVPPRERSRPGPTDHATLIHLQQTAGNAAVARFLERRRGLDTSRAGTRLGAALSEVGVTDTVDMAEEDLAYITGELEAQGEGGASGEEGEGGEGEGGGEGGSSEAAAPAAETQQDDVDAMSAVVLDGRVALSGILADGAPPVLHHPLSDLDPGTAEGIARAGVVTSEFNDAAFKSLHALGFIDLASGKTYPPDAVLDISGFPPEGSGFKKQYRLLPTTTKDHSFKVVAAPAGTYDTGQTVAVNVGGQSLELKKMVEVTEDVATRVKRFEQEHVDDTVAAFQMSFQEAADAVNHFADAPGGENPIYFRGNSEEEVAAYVESRLTDFHGRKKLGGKRADWVDAYKRLLGLTISERDAKGTHSWSLAPKPKVDRTAGTVTHQLNPPAAQAGPSFTEISWDKV